MKEKKLDILSRFVAAEFCSQEEIQSLKEWLNEAENSKEIQDLFLNEWNKEDEKESNVDFIDIQQEIKRTDLSKGNFKRNKRKRILFTFQKVAAIFLLPVILFTAYFFIKENTAEPVYFQTVAVRGQKSNLILPDGTSVWLNSDSKIRYPDNFGRKNRSVLLSGEAYFEVTKNAEIPFIVKAGEAEIRVLGTTFNLKAYEDDNEIETTLIEGKIELTVQPEDQNINSKSLELRPGESVLYNKKIKEIRYSNFKNDEVIGWKNNQLIFRNDNFEKLVKKVERWYDVKIIYDQKSLNDQYLTVELYQGERLNRLLEIIELAIDVECRMMDDKIYIKSVK